MCVLRDGVRVGGECCLCVLANYLLCLIIIITRRTQPRDQIAHRVNHPSYRRVNIDEPYSTIMMGSFKV